MCITLSVLLCCDLLKSRVKHERGGVARKGAPYTRRVISDTYSASAAQRIVASLLRSNLMTNSQTKSNCALVRILQCIRDQDGYPPDVPSSPCWRHGQREHLPTFTQSNINTTVIKNRKREALTAFRFCFGVDAETNGRIGCGLAYRKARTPSGTRSTAEAFVHTKSCQHTCSGSG
jgi:hypothetical protein